MTLWMPGYQSRGALDTAVAAFTPASLPSLVAWYKADTGVTTAAGKVTAVTDQSGHGYNLTAAGNTLFQATGFNGLPAFVWDGSNFDALLTATNSVNLSGTAASFFIVGQMLTGTSNNGRAVGYRGNAMANDFSAAGGAIVLSRDATSNAILSYRNFGAFTLSDAISLATNYRLGIIWDGTNGTHYINNVAGTPAADIESFTQPGTILIGSDGSAGWQGAISEIVITNAAIGSTDRTSLDNYFKTKYGL